MHVDLKEDNHISEWLDENLFSIKEFADLYFGILQSVKQSPSYIA